jgi:AraC-like DNA-binding protein
LLPGLRLSPDTLQWKDTSSRRTANEALDEGNIIAESNNRNLACLFASLAVSLLIGSIFSNSLIRKQAIMNAKQIAESIGYDNTSYFIKLFKAFSGYSPKDYRVQK